MPAKKVGANLKSFTRLSLKLTVAGGSSINYSIVKKDKFEVVVLSRKFASDNCGCDISRYGSNTAYRCSLCNHVGDENDRKVVRNTLQTTFRKKPLYLFL